MSEKVYGIDLGTTYSCIATVDENGARVIANKESEFTTPSVVNFADPTMVVVGAVAKENAVIDPQNTVSLVKTLMGRTDCAITYNGERKSPEEVSSYILRKLAGDAATLTNEDVKNVVITCPAYFGTLEKEATKNAGLIAGLNVLEIINEPTAAAISYGVTNSDKTQTVLVYDLGGGTFDVTIMRIEPGKISMICSDGNHDLGGKNWDAELMAYIAQEFASSTGFDGEFDEFEEQDLRIKTEKAKKTLTETTTALVPMQAGTYRGKVIIERDTFEQITEGLLNETLVLTDNCIQVAKEKGFDKIDEILLVGGSSKMPQIKRAVDAKYGKDAKLTDPDFAVAKGAAIYAADMLGLIEFDIEGKFRYIGDIPLPTPDPDPKPKPTDTIGGSTTPVKPAITFEYITTKSYAIEVLVDDGKDMKCNNMIFKDDTIPESGEVTVTKTFGTAEANMANVDLKVYESTFKDEYYDVDEEFLLGNAILELPGNLPANSPIEVTFTLNKEGILIITGRDPVGGKDITATLQATGVMSNEKVEEIKKKTGGLVVM